MKFYPALEETISQLERLAISPARQEVAQPLIDYLLAKIQAGQTPAINFICTHNSRRSQLAQVWCQTAAKWYGFKVRVYSGGVEVTAFHPNAIKALKQAGFNIEIEADDEEANPTCYVRYSPDGVRIRTFSKVFDHEINPDKDFLAVMTCSDADVNCPVVPGAEQRLALLYEDPKAFDGKADQDEAYAKRSSQIGAELLYVFRALKQKLT